MLQTVTESQLEPREQTAITRYAHGEAQALMERYGIETILDRFANGETLTAIARSIHVPLRTLSNFVNRDEHSAEYARARDLSAEAWATQGWDCLQLKRGEIDSASVNLARYKEAHCMKRAGIANSRYSEKQSVELSGPNGAPIAQSVVHVFVPANGRDVVHEVDGERLDKDAV